MTAPRQQAADLDLLAHAGAILRDLGRGHPLSEMHLAPHDIEALVLRIAERLDAASHTERADFLDLHP